MPPSSSEGDTIQIGEDGDTSEGRLAKVYPQIENGRVIADVEIADIPEGFVDARVLVRLPVGETRALLVPADLVVTRMGLDFVTVKDGTHTALRTIVPGETHMIDGREMVEVLSGLAEGETLLPPDRADLHRIRKPDTMTDAQPKTPPLGIAGALTRGFIRSPLTPLMILAALAVGLVALISLPREEEPQISVPLVDIHIQAPGLRAEDAVKLVTEPMETIVQGINEVEHVYSSTMDDYAMVTARFLVGTSADTAILRVHDKVRANMDRIPVGIAEPLIVGRGIDDVAIVALTLSGKPGETRSPPMTSPASPANCRSRSPRSDNVGLTYLVGDSTRGHPHRPRSRTPRALRRHPATARRQGADGQQGVFHRPCPRRRRQIALVAGETLRAPAQIGNLLLTSRDNRPVYVRDVADISYVPDTSDKLVSNVIRDGAGQIHRTPAVTLAIAKRAGANAVVVSEEILARVDRLAPKLIPDSMALEVTRNYGETADEKANELLFHLGLATVSIVGLVLLAIGWRESIVVAVVIPVTILLTLFAAWVMGYTLNRVSLFALIFLHRHPRR